MLAAALLVPLQACTFQAGADRTVMAWIEGNMTDVADFVLRGAGKGAVNAVSHTSVFRLHANATAARLVVDANGLEEHRQHWQQGAAKSLGIRTYPCIGYGGNISGLRTLFQPEIQASFIQELVAAIEKSDVDGINIDFEPATDVHHPDNNPTIDDGLQFAKFLNALGTALHALPGRRRQLSMDSESIAGACWSMAGANDNTTTPPGHPWNRIPCPWIRYFWLLEAFVALSPELDLIIPMDTYSTNTSDFRTSLWLYQKYFQVSHIGWGLYPTHSWQSGENGEVRCDAP
eukprot:SAG31_NODE_748_length_12390_cov_6.306484_12_plen_289_part_00